MPLTVALIGRPNVGKSTLFNRLTGKQHALTHDTPGVTRDRREAKGNVGPLDLWVTDTAGMEEAEVGSLTARMVEQTLFAIAQADVVMMMVDGRVGLTPVDHQVADIIRKTQKPVVLIVNKCEGKQGTSGVYESYRLGFGEPVPLSAAHGEGLADLYDALAPFAEEKERRDREQQEEEKSTDKHIQIAIVGRPNAGKSTLMNALLKQERMLTGPEAGITRDSISVEWEFRGTPIRLVDTAGMRKRQLVHSELEQMAVEDARRAIQYAQVVVLLLDATVTLEKQDITIANHVIEEGRALVVAVNKWDKVSDKTNAMRAMREQIEDALPHVRGVPIVYLSALAKQKVEDVIEQCMRMHKMWSFHISTAKLNQWLQLATDHHPLPMTSLGRRARIKYITQQKRRPPTFLLFTTRPEDIPDGYMRYLDHSLREEFNLPGVPIRMHLRKTENPYEGRKRKRT